MAGKRGVTMIEVLLVIGIIAILASIVIVAINPARQLRKAQDAERKLEAIQLEKALSQYLISTETFPVTIPEGVSAAKPICREGAIDNFCLDFTLLTPDFLAELPIDDAETNALFSGYAAYLLLGRPQVIAVHLEGAPPVLYPVTNGLVGHWKLDETSGSSAADSTGNGFPGTHSGGPTISTDVPSIGFGGGRSLSFDGVNDKVQVGSSVLHMPGTLTVSFWVKASAWPTWSVPVGKITNSSWSDGWGFYSNGATLYFFVGNYGSNRAFIGAPDLGQWVHMTGTWDGTTINIYKNGIPGTPGASSVATSNAPFVIGEGNGGYFANGLLDDIRIYNRVLTPAEITQIAGGNG